MHLLALLYIPKRQQFCSLHAKLLQLLWIVIFLTPSLYTYVSKTSYGDRSFMCCAAKLWNNLPDEVKNTSSIDIFKIKLKTHLFKKSFKVD